MESPQYKRRRLDGAGVSTATAPVMLPSMHDAGDAFALVTAPAAAAVAPPRVFSWGPGRDWSGRAFSAGSHPNLPSHSDPHHTQTGFHHLFSAVPAAAPTLVAWNLKTSARAAVDDTLWTTICSFLNVRDHFAWAATCSRMARIASTAASWGPALDFSPFHRLFTNQHFLHFSHLHHVRSVNLRNCQLLTDACLPLIQAIAPQLSQLCLERCHGLSSAGIAQLPMWFPSLQQLSIAHCDHIHDGALRKFAQCRHFQFLDCSGCPLLSSRALDHLIDAQGVTVIQNESDSDDCHSSSFRSLRPDGGPRRGPFGRHAMEVDEQTSRSFTGGAGHEEPEWWTDDRDEEW